MQTELHWLFEGTTDTLITSLCLLSASVDSLPRVHTTGVSIPEHFHPTKQQPIAKQPPVSVGITVNEQREEQGSEAWRRGGDGRGSKHRKGRKLPFIIHVMRNIISTVLFWNELLIASWKLYVKTCIWECPDGQSEGPGMTEAALKIICWGRMEDP